MMIHKTGGMTPVPMTQGTAEHAVSRGAPTGEYDRVELASAQYSGVERFAKELASRLSNEVRVHRSEELPQLAQQVQQGSYQVSINELAVQILCFGGDMNG